MPDTRDFFFPTIERINKEPLNPELERVAHAMNIWLECWRNRGQESFLKGAIAMAMYLSLDQTLDHEHQDVFMEIAKVLSQNHLKGEFKW